MTSEHWKQEPEDHDFPAVEAFLSRLVGPSVAAKLTKALRNKKSWSTTRRRICFDLRACLCWVPMTLRWPPTRQRLKWVRDCHQCSWCLETRCGSLMGTTGSA
jgi:hypothetical protein